MDDHGQSPLARRRGVRRDAFGERVISLTQMSRRAVGDLHAMANWALRTGSSGWALLRDGSLRVTNGPFDALDRGVAIGPRWYPWSVGSGAQGFDDDDPGLAMAAVVAQQSLKLLGSDAFTWRGRFGRAQQVVEVTLERGRDPDVDSSVLALTRDVTDEAHGEEHLAAAMAQLLEKQRAAVAGELAMRVAHDLGNLVGALDARVMVLKATARPEMQETIDAMVGILRSQAGLVKRLGAVGHARAEAPSRLDLNQSVVRPAVEMVESWFRMRDAYAPVRLRIDDSVAALPPVHGMRDELLNVVINLLINARDAMPKGGTIWLRAVAAGEGLCLRIEDEGPGIPPADLNRIFESFFSTKGNHGTGLGLANARQVMRGLGGDIVASNRKPRGACFELRFLSASAPPPAAGLDASTRGNA